MKNLLKIELKKALKNKLFLASLLIGCGIVSISFFQTIQRYQVEQVWLKEIANHSSYMQNPMYEIYTLFNHWVGGEVVTLGSSIFFVVFPLLVSIPYGWSYCEEKKSGYVRYMFVQGRKGKYLLAKYVAVFISGGLAMFLPLLFSFLLTGAFFPAVTPNVIYDTSYGVFGSSFMSILYYSKPFLYVFFYLCIDFLFGGLIACMSFAIASFIKIKAVCVILPEFILLAFHNLSNMVIHADSTVIYKELSPLFFLRPAESAYSASWDIILLEGIVLFAVTVVISLLWEKKHEVY